jgi:Mg-chelatase subunit ChlD
VTFGGIEFFSSETDVRKICFVVDRSASMLGTFNKVCNNLKSSVANLRQDQYFDIVFFGGGDIADFGNKRLMRASNARKAAANDFIDSVKPKGTTDAAAALIYAMTIKDSAGNSPQLIYFLTDGLDLNTNETKDISLLIENKRKTLAPSTVINTIGFQTEPSDRIELKNIAKRSGGKFVNID